MRIAGVGEAKNASESVCTQVANLEDFQLWRLYAKCEERRYKVRILSVAQSSNAAYFSTSQ